MGKFRTNIYANSQTLFEQLHERLDKWELDPHTKSLSEPSVNVVVDWALWIDENYPYDYLLPTIVKIQ
jgi:hypothetical protein